ncbi:uncharacterized protein L969DRAFT_401863 [Mixia osmundae IAM 14324]|uniref:Uncharacterized protein n=1 Tax=Mixia osmundae (strain CBS 9802 / IAM 14324 / JCM 22182 / KY 12970) TaxID=764103 RepID=G7E9Z3_MIXOS|nr:uncharacterized protein L969DRAFT_401863 [Mixia osmundae IAM 14324]KEI40096.1 hypothetical protein L969DRAFT_401863 [Mixia osmundae IAM 14324]GAA99462.1 hypothetical protein E5Q_06161 [Mixia osmundae IAM 14324]
MPSLLARSLPDKLPQVTFRIIRGDDHDANLALGVDPAKYELGLGDKLASSFGYNLDDQDWSFPASGGYIKWFPPMESEIAKQVEYDMDEQDEQWLEQLNKERRKSGDDPVSCEYFEVVMDRLEKEWFDLTKRIPKPAAVALAEDSRCAICDDGECENSNAIVFCDGCNLAVHQDCYGVPYIPEGQWLCRKCTVSPDKPVSCVLCPAEGGAFKQTTANQWAHLLCAIWIPETGISNVVYMEPVDGVNHIPKSRWKLQCYLCKRRVGACIQCANRSCYTAFHVTCAREYNLYLKLRPVSAQADDDSKNEAYCHRHHQVGSASEIDEESQDSFVASASRGSKLVPPSLKRKRDESPVLQRRKANPAAAKISRAYKKSYSQGPPLVPNYIHGRVAAYTERIKLRNKRQTMSLVCKYWSLKREARRGAPLLKRLHLEPWTASTDDPQQTDHEKAQKLELILALRNDLERVRMLAELVRKREREKLRRVQAFQEAIDNLLFSRDARMRALLASIREQDPQGIFNEPVLQQEVPDYYDIIKEPRDWSSIANKLDSHLYDSAAQLKADIELVFANAKAYNKPDSRYHKLTLKMEKACEGMLLELGQLDRDPCFEAQTTVVDQAAIDQLTHLDPEPVKVSLPAATTSAQAGERSSKKKKDFSALTPGVRSSARGNDAGKSAEDVDNAEERLRLKRERQQEARRLAREAKMRSRERSEARRASQGIVLDGGVSERIMFGLFESGWILPEGASRRARTQPAPISTGDGAASRVAQADASSSELSSVSSLSPLPSEDGQDSIARSKLNVDAIDLSSELSSPRDVSSPIKSVALAADTTRATPKARQSLGQATPTRPHLATSHLGLHSARASLGSSTTFASLLKRVTLTPSQCVPGLIVWASIPRSGWPAYPAIIVDPTSVIEQVPKSVIASRPDGPSDPDNPLILVQYFDASRNWAWCRGNDCQRLGASLEFDETIQSSKHLKKQSHRRQAIKKAYSLARELLP